MKVRVINKSANILPEYETILSAGMDLRASIEETIILQPMQRVLVPTGLFIELPAGFEAPVRPRSGLALKHGITVLNSPGNIDADYRGEIKIVLVNLSDKAFEIKNAERIAQMIVAKHERVEWELAEDLTQTQRGEGSFGHTGN